MRRWGPVLILPGGLSLTSVVITLSFEPLFVVGGSGPATVWGPAVGKPPIAVGAVLLLGITACTAGRVRIAAVLLWLLFVAATTHRLVERIDGRIDDVWLGVAMQTLPRAPSDRSEESRCRVGRWVARCGAASDDALTSVSPLPFVRWA
jgi:hypothetical protein